MSLYGRASHPNGNPGELMYKYDDRLDVRQDDKDRTSEASDSASRDTGHAERIRKEGIFLAGEEQRNKAVSAITACAGASGKCKMSRAEDNIFRKSIAQKQSMRYPSIESNFVHKNLNHKN